MSPGPALWLQSQKLIVPQMKKSSSNILTNPEISPSGNLTNLGFKESGIWLVLTRRIQLPNRDHQTDSRSPELPRRYTLLHLLLTKFISFFWTFEIWALRPPKRREFSFNAASYNASCLFITFSAVSFTVVKTGTEPTAALCTVGLIFPKKIN